MQKESPKNRCSSLSPNTTPARTVNSSPSTKSWAEAPALSKEKRNRFFSPNRRSQVKVTGNHPDPYADLSYISTGGYSAAGIRVPDPKTDANSSRRERKHVERNQSWLIPNFFAPPAGQ